MTNTLYPLARVVLPSEKDAAYKNLFIRAYHNKLNFSTWMNVFAASKYAYYCELGEIYLRLEAKGAYRLEIIGSKREESKAAEDVVLYSAEVQDTAIVKIPRASDFDGLYFTLIQNPQEPIEIISGAWCTDKQPQRQNKLAIISCTFKKEEWITKNVSLFKQFLKETPEMQGRIKLFIVDNAQTLPNNLTSSDVELFYNMNAGGAGGFTRGLIEARKQEAGYTRVLFMDDDVEILPESFYRTLVLTDYLKEIHKDAFINGAMLDLNQKHIFVENQSFRWGLWAKGVHTACALTYENILKVNKIPNSVFNNPNAKYHGSWWYSCFSMNTVEKKGLPLPLFIRGDDIEWSWRNYGETHLVFNGIFIWHSPFRFRVSKSALYYHLPRNMFFLNMIHTPNFKSWWKKEYKQRLNYLLTTYDYASLDMYTKALEDILRGGESYIENPVEQLQKINESNTLSHWIICNDNKTMSDGIKNRSYTIKGCRKFLYNITYKGVFCPSFLKKRKQKAPDWFPSQNAFIMVKKVELYNPLKNQYEVRKFNILKHFYYKKLIKSQINQIDIHFNELKSKLQESHKEFSSEAFWQKYLNI